ARRPSPTARLDYQHRWIDRPIRIEAAYKLLARFVPEVAIGRHGTRPTAKEQRHGLDGSACLADRLAYLIHKVVEIRGNQITAGKGNALQPRQTRSVRVREDAQDLLRGQSVTATDLLQQRLHLLPPEQAQVDGDDDLLVIDGDRPVCGLENQRGCRQRPVNAGRLIMAGRSPE